MRWRMIPPARAESDRRSVAPRLPRIRTRRRPPRSARSSGSANTRASGAVGSAWSIAKHVAFVAARDDVIRLGAIDLPAKAIDVDLDDVRERIEVFVPDVLGDLFAADHAADIARHVFEQRV